MRTYDIAEPAMKAAAQNIQVNPDVVNPIIIFSVSIRLIKKPAEFLQLLQNPSFHMVGTADSLRTSTAPEGDPPKRGEACSREPSLGSSFDSVEFQK
jgi:hypothetical protein